ncbi:TorF family putative porin [Geothrix alkalitolerans]|uniref:TorF family putative porin n=1 Tax=Geothrix alkalitolerans TaxID=2922724 RepID=UPI001FAFFE9F|nr:TorF family putative porin [Geothrix alkalitolerans]
MSVALRPLALGLALPLSLSAESPAPPPAILGAALSGSATFGSQYIFRGLTQTDGKPTIQGELDLVHPSGFYLSASFSNITWITDLYAGSGGKVSSGVEADLFGGYKWAFAKDWTLDLGAYRYLYPGTYQNVGSFNPNTTEAYLGLSYSWASLKYSRVVSAGNFGVADAEGSSYVDLSLAIPIGESGWTVLAHGGRTTYTTGDPAVESLLNYTDYKLGIAKEFKGYTFTLAGTKADTKDLGYNNAFGRNIGGTRGTFTIAKSF